MPFGLLNAGSVYRRMLDLALAHLLVEYWLSNLDNILVYSMDTWAEYLGHKVSQGGVQMLDQYVKDIQNWPRPTRLYSKVLSFDQQDE